MRLKSKPTKPVRKKGHKQDNLYNGISVQELMDQYGPDAMVELDWWGYDDCRLMVSYEYEEDNISFEKRMTSYEKRLATWTAWYESNKAEIEAEKARRKEAKERKEAKAKARKIAQLEKELKKLKK